MSYTRAIPSVAAVTSCLSSGEKRARSTCAVPGSIRSNSLSAPESHTTAAPLSTKQMRIPDALYIGKAPGMARSGS